MKNQKPTGRGWNRQEQTGTDWNRYGQIKTAIDRNTEHVRKQTETGRHRHKRAGKPVASIHTTWAQKRFW